VTVSAVDLLYQVIDRLAQRTTTLRTATVDGSTATRCTITLAGGTLTNVPYLTSYSPTVGDTVLVLQKPGQLIIIGKAA
jgi:hypothetical protein